MLNPEYRDPKYENPSPLEDLSNKYAQQGKANPDELARLALEEQKRCALLAMENFKTIFERLCKQHPQEMLDAIQATDPQEINLAKEYLNGFIDLDAIKANLKESASTPTDPSP